MTDRIRLLNFPPEINDLIRQAIITTWVRGVQAERDYGGSYEFKLKGNPWTGWSDDSIHARRLVRNIFEGLLNNGWVLALSTDISKKTSDKDTLIFRHQDPAPSTCEWTTIAFSRQDRVRLIDAPPRLVEDVVKALGLITKKASSHDRIAGVYDIQLSAYLWWATGEDAVTARRVLLQLMEVLEAHGFTVYASVDQGNGSEDSTETDTWHCCRPVGWQQGAPVYHA